MFWAADKRCDAVCIDRTPITWWPDADVTKFMQATRHGHDTPALLKFGKAGHTAGLIGGTYSS